MEILLFPLLVLFPFSVHSPRLTPVLTTPADWTAVTRKARNYTMGRLRGRIGPGLFLNGRIIISSVYGIPIFCL